MIEGLVSGWLLGEAETREGKNASKFVVAKVKAAASDGETIVVNVIAFAAGRFPPAANAAASLIFLPSADCGWPLAAILTPAW